MAGILVSQKRVLELLNYDPSTGHFKWLQGPRSGMPAGGDNGQGYIVMTIDGQKYRAHRLAFLYMTARWPIYEVDHINGIRSDNQWSNLRNCTNKENTQNQRKPHRHGTSGFLGVRKSKSRYRADISIDGRKVNIGYFDTPALAHDAYVKAKRKMHSSCTI